MVAKLPRNPTAVDNLKELGPQIRNVAPDLLWLRIYFRGGEHPTNWNSFRSYGPTNARFDHHRKPSALHKSRAILYSASNIRTCLAEVFQDTRTIHTGRRDPWLATFDFERPLRLLDLTGSWPTRAGASMKINTGPRASARAWSRHFYDAFPTIDGIYYPSSMHANQPSIALYERATSALPGSPIDDRPLSDAMLLGDLKRAAEILNYELWLG